MASGDRANTDQPNAAGDGPKSQSGKKAKKLSQKEQSERFIQTAQDLEADESGKAFEDAVSRVLRDR